MYLNVFHDRKNESIILWDDKKGMLKFPTSQFRYAYKKSPQGTFKSIYGDKLEKIYQYHPQDTDLFESDVPLETRFLIDAYEDDDEPSVGHRIVCIDIETDVENGFADVKTADKAITAISLYDYTTKQYTCFILDKDRKIISKVDNQLNLVSCDSEEALISKFLDKWEELNPTIITGWNISTYDMPYLYTRIKSVLGKNEALKLSSVKIAYINKFKDELTIAGISVLDYIELYKKYGDREPTYALAAIGKKVAKMDKITYVGNLHDLYRDDIQKYIDYNLNDVKLVVAIDEKLQLIDLARNICHVGHVPYENYGMSSRFLEGTMLTYLRRNKLVAPNKPVNGREEYERKIEENEEGFEGAYVKEPVPGLYHWVYDLDLTSMYPNIMISLNISPETIIGKIQNWDAGKYLKGGFETLNIGGVDYTIDSFKKMITEKKMSVSSNGMIYDLKKSGLIPTILIKWFDDRKKMRKLAKEYAEKGDGEKYKFYDTRQKIQKVFLNSIYGCVGLPSWRFYLKENAEAVTLTGQEIIKTTEKAINQYYNKILNDQKEHVLYLDTDSAFVSAIPIIKSKMPEVDLEDEKQMSTAILKVASELQLYVNNFYNVMAKKMFNLDTHRFEIKQEVISKSSFWLAKKRYCQLIINKGGIVCDELEVKGIDIVRTSYPIKFREFLKTFVVSLLGNCKKEEINKMVLDFKKNLSNVSVVELAKNTSVKFISEDKKHNYNPKGRQPFEIISGTPAQVKSANHYNDLLKLLGLTKKVTPIYHGQKMKFVYLKNNQYHIDCLALKADGTDPIEILNFIDQYIDRNEMYESELKTKLVDFYSIMKWEFPTENDNNEYFSFD